MQRNQPEKAGSAAFVEPPVDPKAAKRNRLRDWIDGQKQKKEVIPTIPGEGPPAEVWDQYFKTHHPDPAAIGDVVMRLHKAGKPEHLIACIEAALIHGHSQPWMYTVLALAMKQAGRPQNEIERVLLSGVDFSAVNVGNLLYSAAFLTRYGANDRALDLYRQASTVDPTRLEPYVLALKLARDRHDPVAVAWAASGILTRAWNKNHPALHREAEETVRALEGQLRREGRAAEADRLARALAEALERDLLIELSWSGKADLDLLVEEPSGTTCSSDNPTTSGGGVFVHDGMGADSRDAFDKYVCPRGMPGEYRVTVRYIQGEVVSKRAVVRIVRYQGTPYELEERFVVQLAEHDKVVRVTLQQGRLIEPAAVALLDVDRKAPSSARSNRGGMVGRRSYGPGRSDGAVAGGAAGGVGYQPVISILSEGVALSAMAVVSGDRRYVRLSMVPTFSAITDVFTFSFINSGNPNGGGTGVQQPRR
ncbi:MAG: hypothetical protein EXS05_01835 [Planctomycetaceae bacterium]|nr:hypothetical protein [Planctomycetaceae bacterium]